jgi:hypothetical protein
MGAGAGIGAAVAAPQFASGSEEAVYRLLAATIIVAGSTVIGRVVPASRIIYSIK